MTFTKQWFSKWFITNFVFAASRLDIRLSGTGSNITAGRVEVNYNRQGWGTICDDLWSLAAADVACRMLGFQSAFSATREAFFGQGNGTIWLDDVLCFGNESTLLECSHSGLHVHNCRHSEDAGVVCSSKNDFLLLRNKMCTCTNLHNFIFSSPLSLHFSSILFLLFLPLPYSSLLFLLFPPLLSPSRPSSVSYL